jgi:hypothetical protein
VVAVEVDAGDLADLHAGDPHVVTGLESACLGQRGRVRRAGQQRDAVDVEGKQQHRHDDADADRADHHRVLLPERGAPAAHPPTPRHHRHLAAAEW